LQNWNNSSTRCVFAGRPHLEFYFSNQFKDDMNKITGITKGSNGRANEQTMKWQSNIHPYQVERHHETSTVSSTHKIELETRNGWLSTTFNNERKTMKRKSK
jgi:hypothetical protein